MAITLVTGLPGHGKTLYTLYRWQAEAKKEGRPVYHNDIPGLAIPGWAAWDVKDWQELAPGSILIVDEAQFAFPVTGRGQTPDWVQQLATHRHKGIDLVVITQNPMLLDSFVRRLVDRHFHVVRKFGTKFSTVYEFPNGVKEDVAKARSDGIRHEFKYPAEVFGWYKSAELHTVKARIPMRVWLLLVLPLVAGGLIWLAYSRLKPSAQQQKIDEAAGVSSQPATGQPGPDRPTLTPAQWAAAHVPRVEGLAYTAPVYDDVTKPTRAPFPAACIASEAQKRCQCYSQQGTKLDMPGDLCRKIADGGFFVSWREDGSPVQRMPADEARATPATVHPVDHGGVVELRGVPLLAASPAVSVLKSN